MPTAAGDDYCYLTTTGRPHRIEIWYATHQDTIYLLSGGGGSSDWVRNLSTDPTVLVEVDGNVHSGRGRLLDAGTESERARALVFTKYAPRTTDDLTTWRDRALPIAIDLEAP